MDQETLIGPFVLNDGRKLALEHELDSYGVYKPLRATVANGGGLYFHQRCLEINQYVRYDPKSPHQWLNVRTALRNLQQAKVYACFRCQRLGATRQCVDCERVFHGHYCGDMYLISQTADDSAFQCIFCRNNTNFDLFRRNFEYLDLVGPKASNAINKSRKGITKTHLLERAAYTANGKTWHYQPQVGDVVRYFNQGHEDFV